jgi:hypothetical protein
LLIGIKKRLIVKWVSVFNSLFISEKYSKPFNRPRDETKLERILEVFLAWAEENDSSLT